jgi:hypothetical protein
MNYIDITDTEHKLNININATDVQVLADIADDIEWSVFKDGNDTIAVGFDNAEGDAYLVNRNYYIEMGLPNSVVSVLEDETQYNITGVYGSKVVYRGKFQTTSKDLNNLSVNEGKYIKKTTATNYTILD